MKFLSDNTKKSEMAFTLIDVMVGMGVLGVVLVSLFGCFTFGFNVVRLSREELQATQILNEKMEIIRLYNWQQVTQLNFITNRFRETMSNSPAVFSGLVGVSNYNFGESYSNTLRQVTVTVKWTNNNTLRTRSISTFVSQYGMQDYILSAK